jgi:3'-phosphoadenosine 5'-phosphosulfate sulfotransferase (PAPS reductase)/FAD synthetase
MRIDAWSQEEVWAYVRKHELPYNPLLDKGFSSIGDTISTAVAAPEEGERAGQACRPLWHAQQRILLQLLHHLQHPLLQRLEQKGYMTRL